MATKSAAKPTPPPVESSALRRILALVADQKPKLALLGVLIVTAQAGNIIVPFISRELIDTLSSYASHGGPLPITTLLWCAVGVFLATVISSILQSSYNYHLFKVVTVAEDKLRAASFEKYLGLHALFHHGSSSGQIIGRIERGGT